MMSLSLENLRIWDLSPLKSPSFQTVLAAQKCLLMSVLSDCAPYTCVFNARWCHFWGTLCPPMIPAPSQHTPTEFTLPSDAPVGASSELSLTRLHFPLLCRLSLVHLPVLHRRVAFRPATRGHLHAARGPQVQAANPISWSATQEKCVRFLSTLLSDLGLLRSTHSPPCDPHYEDVTMATGPRLSSPV
ncbi:hypothetical protein H4582DRAFT_681199 [Lactarius indigo]|nr:hypothetical protein H4582DRAFT_681199 [Lactarius indigo]